MPTSGIICPRIFRWEVSLNSTVIAIIAGLGLGVAVGAIFGLAVVGAGVGIAAGTLVAGALDHFADESNFGL
jgi:hypothetical protein